MRQCASYLHGVGADNFPLQAFSNLDGQLGLAGAGSSQNNNQRRDHRFPQHGLHAPTGCRHDGIADAAAHARTVERRGDGLCH